MSYAHVSSRRLHVGFKSNLVSCLYTPPETNWCSLSWIQCYLVKWVKKMCTIDLVQCYRLKCRTRMSRLGDYMSDWSQTWFPDRQKQTGLNPMLFGEMRQENMYITHSVGLHAEMSYAHVSSRRLQVGFKSNLVSWLYTPPETNWCSLSWIQCYLVKWVKKTCTIDLVQCNRLKCCTPMSRLGDYLSDWSQTWFPDCTPHQKQTGVVWAESNAIWWNKSRKRVQQI